MAVRYDEAYAKRLQDALASTDPGQLTGTGLAAAAAAAVAFVTFDYEHPPTTTSDRADAAHDAADVIREWATNRRASNTNGRAAS